MHQGPQAGTQPLSTEARSQKSDALFSPQAGFGSRPKPLEIYAISHQSKALWVHAIVTLQVICSHLAVDHYPCSRPNCLSIQAKLHSVRQAGRR
jgi:hypothetical protein